MFYKFVFLTFYSGLFSGGPTRLFCASLGLALLQSFQHTGNGIASRLQLRQHVLDRRLQQSNHVGDELVLRLDVDKFVEMLEDLEDTQDVYTNMETTDEVDAALEAEG